MDKAAEAEMVTSGRGPDCVWLGSLGCAALVHGLYDFCVLGLPGWARIVAAAMIVAVWLRKVHLIEYVLGERHRAA